MKSSPESRPVAMVTGSARGIGRYLSERLVLAGYRVVGCSRKPADWLLDGYSHFQLDVSDEKQVVQWCRQIGEQFGRLDVAINNAGIASMNHSLLMPGATVERILKVNFLGTFLVCREAAKLMRRHGHGRIVNISTIAVPLRLEGEAVYAASKSAVETITRILSFETGSFGITVNALGPTPIPTDLLNNVPEEKLKQIVARLAIKRLGKLEDVWNGVEFFIRKESDYITGQIIYLGGA